MKAKRIKEILSTEIKKVASKIQNYCINSDKDFTRNRKLPAEKIIKGIIGMGSGSFTNELLDLSDFSIETPTTSAFVQQRSKIQPEAFEDIFKEFSKKIPPVRLESLNIAKICIILMCTVSDKNRNMDAATTKYYILYQNYL